MIILGIVLLLIVWLVAPAVPLPSPIWELIHAAGVILLVIGVILLILSFITGGVGPGIGRPVGGRRYYW
jgi:hypothetical protein